MFFVNTDYSREIQDAKFHLAKPNKKVISHIHEKFNENLSVKLSNIHELTFSIPHFINGELDVERNKHVDLIKEKMLIRVTIGGNKEWFIVDSIEEDGDDEDTFNVTAYSLGFELSHKLLKSFIGESLGLKEMAREILKTSNWTIGDVDPKFEQINNATGEIEIKRTIEATDSNALDCILQMAETFGAIVEWDAENRRVSFKEFNNIGSFKGLTIDYGRLLKSIKRSRTTDEMVTRLYAYGNEDLSINSVNPTGQMYIEDFSFFIYPFERDELGNVVQSSYYMSDELCHALLNQSELLASRSSAIQDLTSQLLEKQNELITNQTNLIQLELELNSILTRLDVAKASEDEDLIANIKLEQVEKEEEVASKTAIVQSLQSEIDSIGGDIETLRDSIAIDSGFTQELYDELNFYIIEKEWRDDRYIDAQELYNDAVERFISLREPKVVITVDIENLFEMIDEQYYWDKLNLGDDIKIRYPQMNIEYIAKIIEINFDFEGGTINITIANTDKIGDEMDRLKELLYKSQTTTSILESNKYSFNKIPTIEDEIYRLVNGEWDANKNKITAGVNNQIEIGNRGIIVRNPDIPNEIVIIQSGIIALSKDNGETWKTAIKPDGIVAERLIGNIIAGRNLIITNGSKTFTVDENGVKIVGANFEIINGLPESQIDPNAVGRWNSAEINAKNYSDELKSQIDSEIEDINSELSGFKDTVNSSFKDGIIQTAEAISISKHINQLNVEKSDLDSRYTVVYVDSNLSSTSKTSLYNLKITYNLSHADLIDSINLAISDKLTTSEELEDVNNKFANYNTDLLNLHKKLEECIVEIENKKVNDALESAKAYSDTMKADLSEQIGEVVDELDSFSSEVRSSFADGLISEAEAIAIGKYKNSLNVEKSDIDSRYTTIYGDSQLIDATVKNNLKSKKDLFNTAHANLIQAIDTAIADGQATEDESLTVDSNFSTYRTALSNLSTAFESAVNSIAQAKATKAKDDALSEVNEALQNYVSASLYDQDLAKIQSQIDGSITTWFYDYEPTLTTAPSNSWTTTDLKNQHLGDIFYNTSSGYAYRFALENSIYKWIHIQDNDIQTALQNAQTAKDVADNKRRVFVTTPITPYDVGDLWTQGTSGDLMRCSTSRQTGSYVASDWVKATKYTDDAKANAIETSFNTFKTNVDNAFKDTYITQIESNTIKNSFNQVEAESTELVNTATAYSITTEKTNYSNALSALETEVNKWINKTSYPIAITSTDRTNINNKFTDVQDKKSALIKKIQEAQKTYTDGKISDLVNNEINDVIDRLDGLSNFTNTAFKDGIVDYAEKESFKVYVQQLTNEKADIDARYTKVIAETTYLTGTARTNLTTAKTNTTTGYDKAHTDLITAINNAISDNVITDVERTAVDNAFTTYRTRLSTLSTRFEEALRAIETAKATEALNNANKNTDDKLIVVNQKITDTAIISTVTGSSAWTEQKTQISQTSDKVNIVVTSDNKINAESIATSIVATASALSLISQNIDITGKVTFSTMDSSLQSKITNGDNANTTVNSWKTINKTTIDGGKIETGSISANKIKTDELIVGDNIQMGANATISWANVESKPTIPTTASQVGAISSTYIDANGVWTGYINASKINSGTINGISITGSTITGGSITSNTKITVTTDLDVGNNIYLGNGNSDWFAERTIYFNYPHGGAKVSYKDDLITIDAVNGVSFPSGIRTNYYSYFNGFLDFSGASNITWGNNKPTAVFA